MATSRLLWFLFGVNLLNYIDRQIVSELHLNVHPQLFGPFPCFFKQIGQQIVYLH